MDGDWASWVSTLEKKTSQNFIRPQRSNQLLNYSPVELIILLFLYTFESVREKQWKTFRISAEESVLKT